MCFLSYIGLLYILYFYTGLSSLLFYNNFLLDEECWTLINNGNNVIPIHHPYNINCGISNYIVSKDTTYYNKNNKNNKNKNNINKRWYFNKEINMDLTNANVIQYSMTSFSGNFTNLHGELYAVLLAGPKSDDLLGYKYDIYDGTCKKFNIPLHHMLWTNPITKQSLNRTLFRQFLTHITNISILGDWTQGEEIMVLDNVRIISQ